MSRTMRAMDGERFWLLPKTFFFTTRTLSDNITKGAGGEKKSFRNRGKRLVSDPARDVRCSHARRLLPKVLFRPTGLAIRLL